MTFDKLLQIAATDVWEHKHRLLIDVLLYFSDIQTASDQRDQIFVIVLQDCAVEYFVEEEIAIVFFGLMRIVVL